MRAAFLIALLASPVFADRPTAAQVAEAVAASRAAYAEANKPPTKEEVVRGLETKLNKLRADQRKAKGDVPKLKKLMPQIEAVTAELKAVRKDYTPVQSQSLLMPMDWDNFPTGTVGRVSPRVNGGVTSGQIRCEQIIDSNRAICSYRWSLPGRNTSDPGRDAGSGPFLLVGAGDMRESSETDMTFSAVVTGQFTYATVAGGMRTIPMLEVFDPDKPFE